ncbi:MAG: hypothetical protein LBD23_07565 [Oscillospiraceae bacterium]|jgi:hypothetical protein|nr:hypothetical protein [Oscillospiraceae bacterium]
MKNKQVKITVEPEIANAFKKVCEDNGVSMTSEISHFMEERANIFYKSKKMKKIKRNDRGGRRKEIAKYIIQLEKIRDAENDYKNKIPENLQSGAAYESAEQTVDLLEQAIDILNEAFY